MSSSNPETLVSKLHPDDVYIIIRGVIEVSRGTGITRKPEVRSVFPIFSPEERIVRGVMSHRLAILDSPEALALLVDLSNKGALSLETIQQMPHSLVATGLLSQALLCEVDDNALRIMPAGINFVSRLSVPA